MPKGRRYANLSEAFWDHVTKDPTGTCWEWRGLRNYAGYGILTCVVSGQRRQRAHRVAYELLVGPIPKEMQVLHRCDNPSCVNPAHLFLGRDRDNYRDSQMKGRAIPPPRMVGETNGTAKLTWDDAREIRRLLREGHLSQRQIAERYRVSQRAVQFIKQAQHWREP